MSKLRKAIVSALVALGLTAGLALVPASPASATIGGGGETTFVDGNMWIHNRSTFTFDIQTVGEGTRITFVAEGNLFISDNVTYGDTETDAIL